MENIRMAFEGIKANKMRALLTMLGIIIGVASVIAILTAGDGMTSSVTGQMSSMGTANITVYVTQKETASEGFGGSNQQLEESDRLTDSMIESMELRYQEDIAGVAISESVGSGQAKEARNYANTSLQGVNEGYVEVNAIDILVGRNITQTDLDSNRNVVVVSDKFVDNMFDGNDQEAIGEQIDIYIQDDILTFSIIGVYEYVSSGFSNYTGSEQDMSTNAYIPLTTAKEITGAEQGYSSITVMASDAENSEKFAANLEVFYNNYYENNLDFEVTTMSMSSMLDTLDTMMSTLSIALSVIAAISLLVGGIGVMNIMLVSVTERTREIGTRKALGATNLQIQMQFVVEGIIICSIGGLIGIFLGAGIGYLASSLIGAATLPSMGSIALSACVSVAIGVFFGYYPASKAAKLDPIEALRYE